MNLVALHAIYLLVALAAITVLLVLGVVARIEWCRAVFRAWDYLGAALFGGDGRHSISAYCGAGTTRIHRALRWAIDSIFGAGHCDGAARREGLLA